MVIGGGPAGLMAAERLLAQRYRVDLYDAMPSLGRKFLMAGKSGLNITHAEPMETFVTRFGDRQDHLQHALDQFDNQAVRDWVASFNIETFVGSSGRVFPTEFKAAPLLRGWLSKLRHAGLTTHTRHRWTGWTDQNALTFETPAGEIQIDARATILALGGASWPQLGSDAAWVDWLRNRGVDIQAFRPANAGFDVAWSDHFLERFPGEPVKPVTLTVGVSGRKVPGEFVITESGVEGSGIYAVSAELRDALTQDGTTQLTLDLTPDRSEERLRADLGKFKGNRSISNHIRRTTGLTGVKAGLLREFVPKDVFQNSADLAPWIKALPVDIRRPRPIEEAISSAGGVSFDALDGKAALRSLPGVFCAGEMLDWEAPTGGYLLTACFALGRAAGDAAADYLDRLTK